MSCAPRRKASSARPCSPTARPPSARPRSLCLSHRFTSFAEAFAGLHAHAFKSLHQGFQVALKLSLSFLQLAQRVSQFLRRHLLALAGLLSFARLLALAVLAALL